MNRLHIMLSFLFLSVSLVKGHDVRPVRLDVLQIDQYTYSFKLKIPNNNKLKGKIELSVPPPFYIIEKKRVQKDVFLQKEYQVVSKKSAKLGFTIVGLKKALFNVFFKIKYKNKEIDIGQLNSRKPQYVLKDQESNGYSSYFLMGFKHIIGGIDHLLFVLCLILLIRKKSKLLLVLTSFTLAHTVSLLMSIFDMYVFPTMTVEFMILASLIFLSRETITAKSTLFTLYPTIMAFVFGLIHGLGFASALKSIELPNEYLIKTLFTFNVGIEIGQIAFILLVNIVFFLIIKLFGRALFHKIKMLIPFLTGGYALFLIYKLFFSI